MLALDPLSIVPQGAASAVVLPSLCTPHGQVPLSGPNPHENKDLQKDTVVRWLDDNGYMAKGSQVLNCGQNYVHLKDKNGHEKYGKMHCSNEFCPTCGQKGSRAHKTRSTRARDRLMWAPVLGYTIFTLPKEIAQSKLTPKMLNRLEKESYNIVKNNFKAEGGMVRIHLMGDDVGTLKTHINVLFPLLGTNGIGKVDVTIIEAARKDWTNFINDYFCLTLKTTDIHYNFATTSKKKAHKIKYVLRPIVDAFMFMTLSDQDKHYILSLKGWHNTRWYGQLSNNSYKQYLKAKGVNPTKYEDDDIYLSNKCPVCGERFRYVDIVHKNDLPLYRLRRIDNDTLVDFEVYAALKTK